MPPQPRKIVRIVRVRPTVTPTTNYSQPQPLYQHHAKQQEDSSGCLCAFLGALLGPIGIVVAAIIGKKGGVIASLIGCLIGTVLFILAWFAFLGGAAYLTSRLHG